MNNSSKIEMNKKPQTSIKKNFVMNSLLTMSSIIFPIITFPYASRILLPEGTGRVAFATSVITYFNMFAQLGIPTYGIRTCAQCRDNKEQLSTVAKELSKKLDYKLIDTDIEIETREGRSISDMFESGYYAYLNDKTIPGLELKGDKSYVR